MAKSIYLDYAAATPLDRRVATAMKKAQQHFANPSSLHTPGRQTRQALDQARRDVAQVLGAKPTEIVFTSGSTEAANLAVMGTFYAHPGTRVLASAVEHESVLGCLEYLQSWDQQTALVPVDLNGRVDQGQIRGVVDDKTVLLAVQYANSEIGTIQPLTQIARTVAEIRADRGRRGVTTPLLLFADAAQAGLLSLQVSRLGVDLLSLGGSKIYGPTGCGCLYVRTGVNLRPLLHGGGQENGLRSGTENVAAAVGLAEALKLIQAERAAESKRQTQLRGWLWREIQSALPQAGLNGALNSRLSGNLNFYLPGCDGETLVAYLDQAGFAVATGSACSESDQSPSHVLLAIGRTEAQARSSLRISLGRPTTQAQLRSFVGALAKIEPRVRQLGQSG